eukprot:9503942-Pyramimonas_sp.AAC.1
MRAPPDGKLKSLRVSAVRAEGMLPRGCSLGLASMCTRGGWQRDPLVQVSADAIKTYVQMLQDGRLSDHVLPVLFAKAQETALRPKPWMLVKDPVSALV